MHKETDLVALLHDLPEHNLHRSDVGTVAFVYDVLPEDSSEFYAIEFIERRRGYIGCGIATRG